MLRFRSPFLAVLSCFALAACGASPESTAAPDTDTTADANEGVDAALEAGADASADVTIDAAPSKVAFASKVVSHHTGENGGYNEDKLPGVVLGPPQGGGCCNGSTDVYSLGNGGEIVLGFDVEIVDGPGTDFLVFENPFEIGGDATNILAEPGEVAVSEDGVSWTVFPCTATKYPYGSCAGWHPVYATPDTPIDPDHPEKAGGDPFDLSDIGVKKARFLRIRDMNAKIPAKAPTAGFDLDGVAVLRFE